MLRPPGLKPAVALLSAEGYIRYLLVLGEAICEGVFYSKPGKHVIYSNMRCSTGESVSHGC